MSHSLLMVEDCYSNINLCSFICSYYPRVYIYYVRISGININSRLTFTTSLMWNKGYLLDLSGLSVCDWFINSLQQNSLWEAKLTKSARLTWSLMANYHRNVRRKNWTNFKYVIVNIQSWPLLSVSGFDGKNDNTLPWDKALSCQIFKLMIEGGASNFILDGVQSKKGNNVKFRMLRLWIFL